jgi:D-glycero-alpha-D-manno-heptose-7-phosphate kinase
METSGVEADGQAIRVVNAWAPIRVCDNGGWTDTWFARHGKVVNVAVSPGVDVQVTATPAPSRTIRVVLHAENLGAPYTVDLDRPGDGPHPMLEAAIAASAVPPGVDISIAIHSAVPAGCSTGTSASVMVALMGALDALNGGRRGALEIARDAHRAEVERLGLQSGVQDQLAAALGGVNFIEIDEYPRARVTPIEMPDRVWWELDRRLVLVFLGCSHRSSAVHDLVIASLAAQKGVSSALDRLREAAESTRAALVSGDFGALGRAMIANTEAQEKLHPDLIGRLARDMIRIARDCGAIGWKVNGAGGEGGSLTVLAPASASARRGLIAAINGNPPSRVIPTSLSRCGLRVWDACPP